MGVRSRVVLMQPMKGSRIREQQNLDILLLGWRPRSAKGGEP